MTPVPLNGSNECELKRERGIIKIKQIHFGSYPQTLVTDPMLKKELDKLIPDFYLESDFYTKWKDYNYTLMGRKQSYMWYTDVTYKKEKYRAVYFSSYRYNDTHITEDIVKELDQLNNGFKRNKVYWFKWEPIEWEILKEDNKNQKALLVTKNLVDAQPFCNVYRDGKFRHNGGVGYANNYELSDIRKWLNGFFFNTAFDKDDKEIILTTEVDNSIGDEVFDSNNTQDKVFIISYFEEQKYKTYKKIRGVTDYASIQGACNEKKPKVMYALTRSPIIDADEDVVWAANNIMDIFVGKNQKDYTVANYTFNGVCPMIWIKICETDTISL